MIVRILALCALIFASTAARAEWREARSPNFIVYGDVNEKQLRDFTTKLEKFDSVLRLMWQVPEGADAIPLTVLLLPNQAAVQKVPGNARSWAAGFYRPGPGGSYIVATREDGGDGQFDANAENLLYHEYAHHFMLQYFPTAYPAWYIEGFAELVSTVGYDRKGQAMVGRPAMHRLPGLASVRPLPIERLLTNGTGDLKKDEVESFYGRSWLLTHYLTLEPARKGQLSSFLATLKQGTRPAEAVSVFGDLDTLDKEITRYFKAGKYNYLTLHVKVPTPESIQTRAMRPAEAALAIERLQYVSGSMVDGAEAVAAKVEAVARQYPQDSYPLELLAAARFALDDYSGAERAADAALALAPDRSRALLTKGLARMRLVEQMPDPKPQDWKEARSWIVKANRADGNDPLAYIEYFKSFLDAGERPPEVALEGLLRAHQISPQDQGLRMNVAIRLASAGHFSRATAILRPLASSPHDGGFSDAVREYLAAFEKGRMPGSEPIAVEGGSD